MSMGHPFVCDETGGGFMCEVLTEDTTKVLGRGFGRTLRDAKTAAVQDMQQGGPANPEPLIE